MKEHPILFSGPMVRAILEGRKTQTRRVIKPQPYIVADGWMWAKVAHLIENLSGTRYVKSKMAPLCPYGAPGDRLWVRETHWKDKRDPDSCVIYAHDPRYFKYKRDGILGRCEHEDFARTNLTLEEAENAVQSNKNWKKHPSIHMPRWASRINLEITDIRVERLDVITKTDIRAEGVEVQYLDHDGDDYNFRFSEKQIGYANFRYLWDSINAKRGYPWKDNPWIWVVEFKRVTG